MSADSLRTGWGCKGFDRRPLTRRQLLWETAGGLGGIALASLIAESEAAAASTSRAHAPQPHFAPKAKHVIQIFLTGGVSHVDTFDYKPELEKLDGKPLSGKGTIDTFFAKPGNLMKSAFTFKQRGQSGLWVSDLPPHLAGCADMLTVLRSLTGKSSNYTSATVLMNSGFTLNGFPS